MKGDGVVGGGEPERQGRGQVAVSLSTSLVI